jgi:hypothetical protein
MMHPKVARIGASEKKAIELLGTGGRANGVSVPAHILAITEEQIEAWDSMASTGVVPYEHIQTIPSTAWVVANPSGRPPVGLTVFDTSRSPVLCNVENAPDWSFFTVHPGTAVGGRVTWF